MSNNKFDIFISYRRKDAGDKAEHLKDLLESKFKGSISFDRENLSGLFDVQLVRRIDRCKDFLLVLGKKSLVFDDEDMEQKQVDLYNYLGSCSQEEFEHKIVELGSNPSIDFMRIEIARAIHRKDINIIPVVPETSDQFCFSKIVLPDDIVAIKRYDAVSYSDNPDALFKDIVPKILKRLHTKPACIAKRILGVTIILFLTTILCVGLWLLKRHQQEELMRSLKIETALDGQHYLNWSKDITISQLEAINHILDNMVKVPSGKYLMGAPEDIDPVYCSGDCALLECPQHEVFVDSFWICKYEVSKFEWNAIIGGGQTDEQCMLPIANISYDECQNFCSVLANLTGLSFSLPTEIEWEHAARGGNASNVTLFSGSNNPDEVAWYKDNSGGIPHACYAKRTRITCNNLDLYNMSGNVFEWCDTDFMPYRTGISVPNQNTKVIRGGSYDSEVYEITVFHREPMNIKDKSETVGLRLVIRN